MTSPSRITDLERVRRREARRRSRLRTVGLLPPLRQCDCGRRINGDRWGRKCSSCAEARGHRHWRRTRTPATAPRAVRLAAETLILQLWEEARAGI